MTDPRLIIQISKGLIRHQHARRTLMFYGVLIALLLLFFGSTFLWPYLREHPLIFLGYWAACAWITLLAVLLAIYDIIRVRAEARRAVRRIAEDFSKTRNDSDDANAS